MAEEKASGRIVYVKQKSLPHKALPQPSKEADDAPKEKMADKEPQAITESEKKIDDPPSKEQSSAAGSDPEKTLASSTTSSSAAAAAGEPTPPSPAKLVKVLMIPSHKKLNLQTAFGDDFYDLNDLPSTADVKVKRHL